MPVSGVYKIKGIGDVITGRIEQGSIIPNAPIYFAPTGCSGKAFTIEMHHKNVDSAGPGDNVGINVKSLDKGKLPRVGDVMMLQSQNPPQKTVSFKAMVQVQEHPGQLKCSVEGKGGFTPSVHIRTSKAPCKMSKIHWKMGKITGKDAKGRPAKQEDPAFLEKGDNAEVTFIPKMPILVDTFENCPGLGRIAVMDSNSLVMLGKIVEVEYKS
jgi:elongation factor 1-alpha